ncbi:MAG: hypothetical protein JZU65_16095 [Chlorobium sp.]|nr:hypothetical protein [Chlorobium sp.]
MIFDPSFSIGNVFTLASTAFACIATAVWAKITISRVEAIVFDKNGETRVVSLEALDRREAACKEKRSLEAATSNAQIETLTEVIKGLSADAKQLSICVGVLNASSKFKSDEC